MNKCFTHLCSFSLYFHPSVKFSDCSHLYSRHRLPSSSVAPYSSGNSFRAANEINILHYNTIQCNTILYNIKMLPTGVCAAHLDQSPRIHCRPVHWIQISPWIRIPLIHINKSMKDKEQWLYRVAALTAWACGSIRNAFIGAGVFLAIHPPRNIILIRAGNRHSRSYLGIYANKPASPLWPLH